MNKDIKTIEEATNIINEQDRIIGELTREVKRYKEYYISYNNATRQHKKDLGYDESISFDIVWKDILDKLGKS